MIKMSLKQQSVGDIEYIEVDPKDVANNKSSFKDFLKLFRQFDKAEAAYYKELHWHWNICTEKEIKEVLTVKSKKMFVAKLDERIIGFVTLWPSKMGEGTWVVAQICVDEDYRGKKIGRGLLQCVFDNTGKDQIFLTVTATNEAGKHLYESMGFKTMSHWMWKER